ncbi:hypothetical protein C4573_00215 [Candidatus Woesearchaeota archaeon]|nr:MAG: hypothetical protein C4573_00215 [Candidatus Woesearchaeota archaeon]
MGDMDKKILDAPEQHYFHIAGGVSVKNIKELLRELKKMKTETYQHHVNANKNDFSNWLNDIFQETKLAKEMYTATKSKAAMLIAARIKQLEKKK